MPLQDMQLPVLLSGGVDTKTDAKSVNLGKLLVLENGVFENPGKIRKRFGYDSLGNSIDGGGTISAATSIAANLNTNQLIQTADDLVYGYSTTKGKFVDIGSSYPVTMSNSLVFDSYELQGNTGVDMAVVGGFEVYSYITSSALSGINNFTTQFLIQDASNKNITYKSAYVNSPEKRAAWGKLVQTSTAAYHMRAYTGYLSAGGNFDTIYLDKIDPTLTSPITASITISRSGATSGTAGMANVYDMLSTPLGIVVAYASSTTNIVVSLYDFDLVLLNTANVTVSANATVAVALAYESSNSEIFLVKSNRTTNLSYQVFDSTLTSILPNTVIATSEAPWSGTAGFFTFIQVAALQTANNQVTVLATTYPSGYLPGVGGTFPKICKFNVSNAAVLFTDYNFCVNGQVSSKIQSINDKFFVVTGFASDPDGSGSETGTGQNTYFLNEVTTSGSSDVHTLGSVARFDIGTAATTFQSIFSVQPELILNDNNLIAALLTSSSLGVKTSTNIRSISRSEFDFSDSTNSSIITVPDTNFFIAQGQPISIDTFASEENFNQFPIILSAAATVSPGGLTPSSTYSFYVVYEWVDTKGQVHQSAPSEAATITLGPTESQVEVVVSLPLRTTKQTPVKLVFYRTTADGVTPYREATLLTEVAISSRTFASGNVYTFFPGTLPDAQLSAQQILYTTGGILPNDPAPNSKFQWIYKNRVMLGGLDDGNTVWYSKTRVAGEPTKFSAFFYTNVDIAGGDVTAGGTLDDKCIFFKKNKIFYMFGDGPNDAGGGQAFSIPQEISSPVGCAYPKSVVAMPNGLMFKSEKGIYLLDRGLNASYIGYPVEQYNQYDVTSALHMAKYNQVVFTLSNGTALIFDYLVQQWGVYTNVSAAGSTLYGNQHTYVQSNGIVLQQGSTYLDSSTTPITLTIGLPWIKLNGLQGFQRAREFLLVGEYKSPHTLSVSMAYNYNDTYTQTARFTPTNTPVLQFRTFLTLQKCEALKVLITDNGTATTGEGFSLSEMMLEIGVKKGHFKLSSSKSVS